MTISHQCVKYEKVGHKALVTLDRPEVLNALNDRVHEELAGVWDDFAEDDDLWVAVLRGAGGRAFSVGQDLKELDERLRGGAPPRTIGSRGQPGWPRLTERFDLTKPVVAAVHGFAYGGGFELALACDAIIAADDTVFALPEARLGLVPGAGGIFRLTRDLPFKLALGYLLTGESIAAQRAYELGLVHDVVSADRLDARVEEFTDAILGCAPLSVRAIKEAAYAAASSSVEEAFARRYPSEERRRESLDAREGPRAFVERRPPVWRGA